MRPTEPIEVAREINDAFAATPFAAVREATETSTGMADARERLTEMGHVALAGISELVDEEIVIGETDIEGASILSSGGGTGRDAWWAWFRAWFEPWDELTVTALDYEAVGAEGVLSDIRVQARGEISGAPVTLDLTQLWVVRSGRVVRYGIYTSHAAAQTALEQPRERVE